MLDEAAKYQIKEMQRTLGELEAEYRVYYKKQKYWYAESRKAQALFLELERLNVWVTAPVHQELTGYRQALITEFYKYSSKCCELQKAMDVIAWAIQTCDTTIYSNNNSGCSHSMRYQTSNACSNGATKKRRVWRWRQKV